MGRKPKSRQDPYGAWLTHLRKEQGLTQQRLAQLTGISQQNIAYWERTGNLKGRSEILKLSKALKTTADQLLRIKK